jgi:hypothetical protein
MKQFAAKHYRPALVVNGIDAIDLECPQGQEGSRGWFDESIVHRENKWAVVENKRDPTNGSLPQKLQAGLLRE